MDVKNVSMPLERARLLIAGDAPAPSSSPSNTHTQPAIVAFEANQTTGVQDPRSIQTNSTIEAWNAPREPAITPSSVQRGVGTARPKSVHHAVKQKINVIKSKLLGLLRHAFDPRS